MNNNYGELKLNKVNEEDGLMRDGNSVENTPIEKNGKYKLSTSTSIKKQTNSNNLNNLILSCVKNEEYCYDMLDYLKKIGHFSQTDYYSAYTQILYCFKPKEINEMAKIRKHLKNQWSRDDPGFLLILIFNLFFSTIALCFTFGKFNIYQILQLFFFQAFFCLITVGLLMAFIFKYVAEKYFKNEELGFNRNQAVEFLYAFDIHCNAFVPFYFTSIVLQFPILYLVMSNSILGTFISNTLFLLGILYYFYVTLFSYYCKRKFLPFIKKNKYVTVGIWPLLFVFFVISFANVNLMQLLLDGLLNK